MRNVVQLAASILIGLIGYVVLFTSIVHRPMTIDSLGVYLDRKSELLKSVPGRRILVLAGSNGRFSHSCEELERATGIPAINLSINAEISLAYQFSRYLPLMHPGDVLYLPLEYRSRSFPKVDWVGVESNYLIYNHGWEIFHLYSPVGVLHSLFNFDIRYLISSIGEMTLNRLGVQRRFNLGTLNKNGDEFGHTASKAAPYKFMVASIGHDGADPRVYEDVSYWQDLGKGLDAARKVGVICVGGLPTTFDDFRNPRIAVDFLNAFYREHKACFVVLPNQSLYPRDYFYDTNYHLQEEHQREHTRLLAPMLGDIFRQGGCPGVSER